jgi:hypothetical protein
MVPMPHRFAEYLGQLTSNLTRRPSHPARNQLTGLVLSKPLRSERNNCPKIQRSMSHDDTAYCPLNDSFILLAASQHSSSPAAGIGQERSFIRAWVSNVPHENDTATGQNDIQGGHEPSEIDYRSCCRIVQRIEYLSPTQEDLKY